MRKALPTRRWGAGLALLVVAGLTASPTSAPAAGPPAATAARTCPAFRVLHADRIGAADFPAGSYTITLEDPGLTCSSGGELLARFLEDFNGVLPSPWKVSGEGSGKAAFLRAGSPGFSVALGGRREEGGTNPDLGTLCPNTFTVNSSTAVDRLRFGRGAFLIYLPKGSGITCNRAAVLFTRFLGAGGRLPAPWRLTGQTATFFKPTNPVRSAFRIEPLDGSGRG